MTYTYKPSGVCSMLITLEMDEDIIRSVRFTGGCSGNTQGVAALAEGRSIDEVVNCISGIKCGMKPTSCPDQLAKALLKYKKEVLA